jgi:hypothetical protein
MVSPHQNPCEGLIPRAQCGNIMGGVGGCGRSPYEWIQWEFSLWKTRFTMVRLRWYNEAASWLHLFHNCLPFCFPMSPSLDVPSPGLPSLNKPLFAWVFFFLAGGGCGSTRVLELRTLHFLAKNSTTQATSPAIFALGYFPDRVTKFLPNPQIMILLPLPPA